MPADQPGCCAQRLLIIPADYMSGSADRALMVEKIGPVGDHARTPLDSGSKLTRTIGLLHSSQRTAAVDSETTQGRPAVAAGAGPLDRPNRAPRQLSPNGHRAPQLGHLDSSGGQALRMRLIPSGVRGPVLHAPSIRQQLFDVAGERTASRS